MSYWVDVLSKMDSLIGVLIGGFITLIAVNVAHKRALERDIERERFLVKGFLDSIHDEVEVIWKRYQDTMGDKVEKLPEGAPLLMYYPVTQDYFTVYNGNSSLIGKIENHELRQSIIAVYTKAKGLLDSYKMNNEMLQKYENFNSLYRERGNPSIEGQVNAQYSRLVDYAEKLKEMHNEVREGIESLKRKYDE